ncbi:hypothetical protein EVAR_70221_1 [Eumeta japonica]|uniref:Uncharacterized protein n=1 Tax=Eumeta variegata TaxID=151549 RepID=A0A4C1SD00_EUMVA|nr:hypothetical protein EVAR_70221_1 [Eumeta japonica]
MLHDLPIDENRRLHKTTDYRNNVLVTETVSSSGSVTSSGGGAADARAPLAAKKVRPKPASPNRQGPQQCQAITTQSPTLSNAFFKSQSSVSSPNRNLQRLEEPSRRDLRIYTTVKERRQLPRTTSSTRADTAAGAARPAEQQSGVSAALGGFAPRGRAGWSPPIKIKITPTRRPCHAAEDGDQLGDQK